MSCRVGIYIVMFAACSMPALKLIAIESAIAGVNLALPHQSELRES